MINLDIVSERTNKTRLLTSEKFGVKPTITILTEGKFDYYLLKDAIESQENNHNVILSYIPGGTPKTKVIETVNRGAFDFGIVDMDYDFKEELVTSEKIISTKGSCCTFGMVSPLVDFEIIRLLIISATNYDKDVKIWLDFCRKNDYKNGKKLSEYIKQSAHYATILRLFAGWLGSNKSSTADWIPSNLHRKWLKDHLTKNIEFSKWCEDSFEDELLREFRKFESNFNEFLYDCGINDHDFIQSIEILITKRYGEIFDVGLFEQGIKKKFRVDKTHMPKLFRSKLKKHKLLA